MSNEAQDDWVPVSIPIYPVTYLKMRPCQACQWRNPCLWHQNELRYQVTCPKCETSAEDATNPVLAISQWNEEWDGQELMD